MLTEQPSRWRYLMVSAYFVDFINWKEPQGCNSLLQDLDQHAYQPVVIGQRGREGTCLQKIKAKLQEDYQQTIISFGEKGQRCGTSSLIRDLSQYGHRTITFKRFRTWLGCATAQLLAGHQYGGKDYLVLRRE